jgi:hypothetical protein
VWWEVPVERAQGQGLSTGKEAVWYVGRCCGLLWQICHLLSSACWSAHHCTYASSAELDTEHTQKALEMEHTQQLKLKERQKFFEEAFQQDMEQYLSTGYLQIAERRGELGHFQAACRVGCGLESLCLDPKMNVTVVIMPEVTLQLKMKLYRSLKSILLFYGVQDPPRVLDMLGN